MESFSVLRSVPREDAEEITVMVIKRTKAFHFLCFTDIPLDGISLGFALRYG